MLSYDTKPQDVPKTAAGLSPLLGPRGGKEKGKDKPGGSSKMAKMRAAMHIGSVVDDWPMYSANGDDYIIGDAIGFGASSVVHQGVFKPLSRACAIKIIDLEAYARDTEELRRETQLMSLSKHPNVLRVRGCWVRGTKLHIATRLMSSGSMLDIMRFSSPEGFDETVIATVLKQALQGLTYLHINGWLHRDLKAANMLVDDDGTVLLADFGVGVFVGESGKSSDPLSTQGKRKSFVGTPCWMAPEVIERKHYGTKADIWSFGITALELAQGRAPNSRLNPVKVLMRTMQDEPPQLDRSGNAHKYSKTMEDFVRVCLQKDPSKRPSAEKLLAHAFFKQVKPPKYLVTAILAGLPPLADRQERKRKLSLASTMREYMSWDFESASSRVVTPNAERNDPFRNFAGIFHVPSPHGSIRSAKLVSIDGQHVLATEADHVSFPHNFMRRFSSQDCQVEKYAGVYGKTPKRSTDRLGHTKSVSFDEVDMKKSLDRSASVEPLANGYSIPSLASIGEKGTPTALAASAAEAEIPPLQLTEPEEKESVLSFSPSSSPPLLAAAPLPTTTTAAVAAVGNEDDKNEITPTGSPIRTPANRPDLTVDNVKTESTASSPRPTSTPATSAPSLVVVNDPECWSPSTPVTSPKLPTGPHQAGTNASQGKLMLQRVISGASVKLGSGNRSEKRESVFGKLFKNGAKKLSGTSPTH